MKSNRAIVGLIIGGVGLGMLGLSAKFISDIARVAHETTVWKRAYFIVDYNGNNKADFDELEELGIELGVVKRGKFKDLNELEKQVRTAEFSKVEAFVNKNYK